MRRTLNELSDILDSGKMVTRQEMRNIMWGLKEVAEALIKQHRNLNNKVNKVTAYYRHGNTPSRKTMVELCNEQIDVEQAVSSIKGGNIKPFGNSCKKCGIPMSNTCLGCMHDG